MQPRVSEVARLFLVAAFLVLVAQGPTFSGRGDQVATTIVGGGVCTTCVDTNKQADKTVTQGQTDPNVQETGECTKEKKAQMTPEELAKKCPASKQGTTTFTDENGKQVQVSSGGGDGPVTQGSGGSASPSAAQQYADGHPAISQTPIIPPDAYTTKAIESAFQGVSDGTTKLAYPITPPASTGSGLDEIVNGPDSSIPGTTLDYSRPPSVSLNENLRSSPVVLNSPPNSVPLMDAARAYLPVSSGASGFGGQEGFAYDFSNTGAAQYAGIYGENGSPMFDFSKTGAAQYAGTFSATDVFGAQGESRFPISVVDPSGNTIATFRGEDFGIDKTGSLTISAEQLAVRGLGAGSMAQQVENTLLNEFQNSGADGEVVRAYLASTDVSGNTLANQIASRLADNESQKNWLTQTWDSVWGGQPKLSVSGSIADPEGAVSISANDYVQGPGMTVGQERPQSILNQENPDIAAMSQQGITGSQSGFRTNGTLNQNNETISSVGVRGLPGTQSAPGPSQIMNQDNPLFAAWDQKGLPGTQSGITERSPDSQPITVSNVEVISAAEFARRFPTVEVPPLQTTDVRTVPDVPGSTPYKPVDSAAAKTDTKAPSTPTKTASAPPTPQNAVQKTSVPSPRPSTGATSDRPAQSQPAPAADTPVTAPASAPSGSASGGGSGRASNPPPVQPTPIPPIAPAVPGTLVTPAPAFLPVIATDQPSSFQVPLPSQGCTTDYCPPSLASVAFTPTLPPLGTLSAMAASDAGTPAKSSEPSASPAQPEREVVAEVTGTASCYDPTHTTSCGGKKYEGGLKTATGKYVGDKQPTVALSVTKAKELGCGYAGKKCEALVTVTSGPNEGKSVVAMIDDNGPLPHGRVADLSSKTKAALGGGNDQMKVKIEIYAKEPAPAVADAKTNAKKTAEAKPNCNLLSGRDKLTCLFGKPPMALGGPHAPNTFSGIVSGASGSDTIVGGAGNDTLSDPSNDRKTIESAQKRLQTIAGTAPTSAIKALDLAKEAAGKVDALAKAATNIDSSLAPDAARARELAKQIQDSVNALTARNLPLLSLFGPSQNSEGQKLKQQLAPKRTELKQLVGKLAAAQSSRQVAKAPASESAPAPKTADPSAQTPTPASAPSGLQAARTMPAQRVTDPAQEDKAIRAQAIPLNPASRTRLSVADVEGTSFARALVVKIKESVNALSAGEGPSPITPLEVLGILKQETNNLAIYETSNVGAQGIAQMMPPNGRQAIDEIFSQRAPKQVRDTLVARYKSPEGLWRSIQAADPRDAWRASVDAGVAYLATVRDIYKADSPAARARIYNGGPSQRDVATKSQTQDYWQKTAMHMRDIARGAVDKYRSVWNRFAQSVQGGLDANSAPNAPAQNTGRVFRVALGGQAVADARNAQLVPVKVGATGGSGITADSYINSLCQPDAGCGAKSLGGKPDATYEEWKITDPVERRAEYARQVARAGDKSEGMQPVLVDNCQYAAACGEIMEEIGKWNAAHPDKALIPMVNNPLLVAEKLGNQFAAELMKTVARMGGGGTIEQGAGSLEQNDAFRKSIGNPLMPLIAMGNPEQGKQMAQQIIGSVLQNIGVSVSSVTEGGDGYRDAEALLPVALGSAVAQAASTPVERALESFARSLGENMPTGSVEEVKGKLEASALDIVRGVYRSGQLNSHPKLASLRGDGQFEVRAGNQVYRVGTGGAEKVGTIRHVTPAPGSAPAPVRISGTNVSGINPVIARSMEEASRLLPAGYTARVSSAARTTSTVGDSFHVKRDAQGNSLAVDVKLYDATGNYLTNIRAPQNFATYRDFMQNVKAYQDKLFPQLASRGRWGGYFVSGVGQDLMHYDLGPKDVTAAGNWEQGLYRSRGYYGLPGDVGVGMGPSANYTIPDPASLEPAEFDEFVSEDGSLAVPLQDLKDTGKVRIIEQELPDGTKTYAIEYEPPASERVPPDMRTMPERAYAAVRQAAQRGMQQVQDMFKNLFGGQQQQSGGSSSGSSGGSSGGGSGGQGTPAPVPPAPVQPAAMRFACTPDTVVSGSSATLLAISWQCPAGTRSEGLGFSTLGSQTGTTTLTVSTSSAIVVYKLSCIGAQTQTLTCSVRVKHPRVTLVAKPTEVAAGESGEFHWSAVDVDSCKLYGPPSILVAAGGSTGDAKTLPMTRSSVFRIVCNTGAATTTTEATMHVIGDTEPPLETRLP